MTASTVLLASLVLQHGAGSTPQHKHTLLMITYLSAESPGTLSAVCSLSTSLDQPGETNLQAGQLLQGSELPQASSKLLTDHTNCQLPQPCQLCQ